DEIVRSGIGRKKRHFQSFAGAAGGLGKIELDKFVIRQQRSVESSPHEQLPVLLPADLGHDVALVLARMRSEAQLETRDAIAFWRQLVDYAGGEIEIDRVMPQTITRPDQPSGGNKFAVGGNGSSHHFLLFPDYYFVRIEGRHRLCSSLAVFASPLG